jgi:hypothetical protein
LTSLETTEGLIRSSLSPGDPASQVLINGAGSTGRCNTT